MKIAVYAHAVDLKKGAVQQDKALCFLLDQKPEQDPGEPQKKKQKRDKEKAGVTVLPMLLLVSASPIHLYHLRR